MRKLITFLLLSAIALSLFGCSFSGNKSEITFYYTVNSDSFDGSDNFIVPYVTNRHASSNYQDQLDIYFAGPEKSSCESPFPNGTVLEAFESSKNKAHLTLSSQFAELSDIDLMIACACITRTVIELTKVNFVQICVKDTQLLGEDSLTFDLNSFTYSDNLPADYEG